MPVANYLNLNSVYVLITTLVFIVFLAIFIIMFNILQIEISKELNTDCSDPLAIYFDKKTRDRCLAEKIQVGGKLTRPVKYFNRKTNEIKNDITNKDNIQNIKIQDLRDLYEIAGSRIIDISNNYKNLFNDKILTDITDKVDEFEGLINDNIEKITRLGSSISEEIGKNTKINTTYLSAFNNIIKYLNVIKIHPNLGYDIAQGVKTDEVSYSKKQTSINKIDEIKTTMYADAEKSIGIKKNRDGTIKINKDGTISKK
jgi:hypothetical protein